MFKWFLQILSTSFIIVLVFVLHSCVQGPVYKDMYSVFDITSPPHLRVGLSRHLAVPSTTISINGHYRVKRLNDSHILYEGKDLSHGIVSVRQGKITIGNGKLIALNAISILPYQSGSIEIGGRAYRGSLNVHSKDGKISLVNLVQMEDYLAGVVPKEMSLSKHPQALKAQIVAARTYALYELKERRQFSPHALFDLYDDTRSQVYAGIVGDYAYADQLVRETRGLVMTYQNRIFKSFYSSTCGGHTEAAWEILNPSLDKIAPLSAHPCTYCTGSKYYNWEVMYTKEDLRDALFPDRNDITSISAITILKKAKGGHLLQIGITIEPSGKMIVLNANTGFRHPLLRAFRDRSQKLRSAKFTIRSIGNEFIFQGHGFGHGVGLCQIGAYRMAEKHIPYSDILHYYYPGSEITKLY